MALFGSCGLILSVLYLKDNSHWYLSGTVICIKKLQATIPPKSLNSWLGSHFVRDSSFAMKGIFPSQNHFSACESAGQEQRDIKVRWENLGFKEGVEWPGMGLRGGGEI